MDAPSSSVWQAPALAERIDSTLSARLREIVGRGSLTETELRELTAQADGWARTLRAQIHASEQRLRRLTADGSSGVAEFADELRRVETLRPQLREMEALVSDLETTARELRTAWLLGQAESPRRV
jgi:chromosome segregation ATPase